MKEGLYGKGACWGMVAKEFGRWDSSDFELRSKIGEDELEKTTGIFFKKNMFRLWISYVDLSMFFWSAEKYFLATRAYLELYYTYNVIS